MMASGGPSDTTPASEPGAEASADPTHSGGVRVVGGFGLGAGAPGARAEGPPGAVLLLGDFGGAAKGRFLRIDDGGLSEALAQIRPSAEIDVANRIGDGPATLRVALTLGRAQDLDPERAARLSPVLAAALGGPEAWPPAPPEGPDPFARLRHAQRSALATGPVPAAASPSAAPATGDPSVDRLLDMVDLPGPAADAPAKAAVSSFVAAIARRPAASRASGSGPSGPAADLARAQAALVFESAAWRGLEQAWRGVKLVLAARNSHTPTEIWLCDVAEDDRAAKLEDFARTEALNGGSTALPAAIVVVGAYGSSARDMDRLVELAEAADGLRAPVLVSLAPDFFQADPARVAALDEPTALLDGPGFDAFRGLRMRAEAHGLAAVWNDLLGRPEQEGAPACFVEPAFAVAAHILGSFARVGWPSEILGAEAGLAGLEVAEIALPTGRRVAMPVRAAVEARTAQALGRFGIITVSGRPDRDQVLLTAAPMLAGLPGGEGHAALGGLPFALASARMAQLLELQFPNLVAGRAPEMAAAAVELWLADVLATTGRGARARVDARPDPVSGAASLHIELAFGADVARGLAFAMEVPLQA